MPYYRWRGVTLDATYCKGTLFAHSEESLDALLYKQEIALISCRPTMQLYILPISYVHKVFFFEHLQALLDAGVHVWQALTIISEQISDARFADIVYQVSHIVQEGKPLHEAMARYAVFSSEMVHITEIGMQAGNISIALQALCQYLQETDQFKKKLRSALLLPLVTLALFVTIILVILFAIIPQYADLFASMGKELPRETRLLLKLHDAIVSYYMVGYLIIAVTFGMVVWQLKSSSSIKMTLDRWILNMPYLGSLLQKIALVHFLRSLGLLLQGGMSLVPALKIANQAVSNLYMKEQISQIVAAVEAGQSVSAGMRGSRSGLFAQDLVLLITVGEETGRISDMIDRAATMYQKRVQQMLVHYTTVLQPTLMILLGLMVAGLIFAVYMPLFNLADLV